MKVCLGSVKGELSDVVQSVLLSMNFSSGKLVNLSFLHTSLMEMQESLPLYQVSLLPW